MTRMISLPFDLDTRICYQFKNPLDKGFFKALRNISANFGDPFYCRLATNFLVPYGYTNYFLIGIERCPLLAIEEAPRQKSQFYNLLPTLLAKFCSRDHCGLKTMMKVKDKTSTISRVVIDVHIMELGRLGDYHSKGVLEKND